MPYGAESGEVAEKQRKESTQDRGAPKISINADGTFTEVTLKNGKYAYFDASAYLKAGETAYLCCTVQKTPCAKDTGGGTIKIGG